MFTDRIQGLRAHVGGDLDPDVLGVVLDTTILLDDIDAFYSSQSSTGWSKAAIDAFEQSLDNLREALSLGGNSLLLAWVGRTARTLRSVIQRRLQVESAEAEAALAALSSRLEEMRAWANTQLDVYTLSQDREEILDQARRSVENIKGQELEARRSVGTIREDAGTWGETQLSSHFGEYAEVERAAAHRFRIAAITGVSVALFFALVFGPIAPGDWAHLTWRVAVVAGAGTLAAYFARQAGQHRRIYNWAKSLEVQLLSFPAFIQPLGDEERAEAYRALARRILSAPPEKGTESADDTVGAAQLLELAALIAKRT